ncbi:Glycosidase [Saccharicrinis carchari]|uniref:Glycosidase n=1 Tax=Saccharicrinis carchari TaxID=1168039 RepID=A0A521F748_SACCC|nr:glycoside hydrolase family 13 protein [Saccharicrinis carchari]SMO91350.1 Glycosidase [Saccharicrinis carchari]
MNFFIKFCFLFILPTTLFSQKIERIEPKNWWIGMKYNTVTLLLYGKDISDLQPEISYPDVLLVNTEKSENKNYLFLSLKINPTAKPGIVNIIFKKNGEKLLTKKFPILKREANSAERDSYTQKDAIYLIVPDRFSNGDPSNDIIPNMLEKTLSRKDENKRHGGDIQGIINHLDYIKSLGFTQIWNTPLTENNQPNYSYHGYATTDYYKIDPRFGTNEDFRKLVYEAKKRNIGIIWDVVLNHCGSEYYFIKDLPCEDWVNLPKSRTRTNHLKSTITDIYAAKIDKEEYTDGWFDNHMADLNQRNPLVAKYLIQNTIWWIEYAGLSGLREDTFSYIDKEFLSNWTKTILAEYPKLNIVGEELSRNIAQTAYWQIDKKNTDGYQCYLPTLMDFSLNEQVISSLNRTDSWFSTWRDVYQSVAQDYLFPHPENQLIFPDNHDLDRFYSRINKNFEKWKLGIAMYTTMRGIPQFLYGTEVLFFNDKAGSDGQRRSDFYGGWDGDSKNAVTRKGLTKEEKEAQYYIAKLLNWRKTNSAITNGKFMHYAPDKNDVYVYFRYNDKQKVMVILNKNSESVLLDMNRYNEVIPNKFKAKEIISDQEIIVENTLRISAKTAMILDVK